MHIGGSAFLGVQIARRPPAPPDGVPVAGAVRGSAAAKAGITGGDAITEVDGTRGPHRDALQRRPRRAPPRRPRAASRWINASGTSHSATVTLGDGPVA